MTDELMPDRSSYRAVTRDRYRDTHVARKYAAGQRGFPLTPERALAWLERRAIRSALARLAPVGSIVDVPCGTGKLAPLRPHFSAWWLGVDVSTEMLANYSGTSTLAVADAEDLPFANERFDVGICLRLLHRVPDDVAHRILTEVCRVSALGVVISYSGLPNYDAVYRRLHSVARRGSDEVTLYQRRASDMSAWAAESDFEVTRDVSVSGGVFTERILTAVRRKACDVDKNGA